MTRLTVPVGPLSPGRAARAPQQAVPTAGAALADFGQVMAQVGKGLEAERLDRELKRSQVDLTRDVNDLRLSVEQIGDPDAADTAWSQGVQALRERYETATAETGGPLIDPKNREPFGLAFDQLTNAVAFDLGRRTVGLRNAEREASFLRYAHEAARAGANADAGTVDTLVSWGAEQVDGMLAAGGIDAAEAERLKLGLQSDISNARAIRMVSDDPEAFIAAADAGDFLGLEADTVARYRAQAQGKLEADARAAATAAEKAATERKKAIDDRIREIRDIAADGREAVDERFLEDPEVQQSEFYGEAKAAIALREENGSLATLTPAQLAALIDEEEARKVTKPYQTERLKVLQERLEEHETGYDEDPIAYAGAVGVAEISPIDFAADSDTLVASLLRRAETSKDLVARGYGKVQRALTRSERDTAKEALARDADPNERARLATIVTATLGPSELAGLGADPALMHAGMLGAALPLDPSNAGQPPRIVREITRGQATLHRDNVRLPDIAERRGLSFGALDAVFADLPAGDVAQQRVLEAADSVYANRMGRIDPTGQDIDETVYNQALHEVLGGDGPFGDRKAATGGIGEINGEPILLPMGISAARAEAALSGLGAYMPSVAMGGGPSAFDPKKLQQELAVVSDNQTPDLTFFTRDAQMDTDGRTEYSYANPLDGKYPVAISEDRYVFYGPPLPGSGGEPTVLRDTDGNVFTFSLRKLIRRSER